MPISQQRMTVQQQKLAQRIIQYSYFEQFQQLTLDNCDQDPMLVLKYKDWSMIKMLNLNMCRITNNDMSILARKQWTQLNNLIMSGNQITGYGIRSMISCKFPNLTQLMLSNNNIGSYGIKMLIQIDMPLLQTLIIQDCFIGNQGAKHLCKSTWPKLKRINITQNNIEFDGFQTLVIMNNWKQLIELSAANIKIDCIGFINFALLNSIKPVTFRNIFNNQLRNQVLEVLGQRRINKQN